jgi:hypothetical protein
VIRAAPPAVFAGMVLAALLAAAVPMAGAQTANSPSGGVGSASLQNGYPAGGGAIALPAPGNAIGNAIGNAAAPATSTAATGAGSAGFASGGGAASAGGAVSSGGRGGASAGSGVRSSGAGGGGENWVLCPPAGSFGSLPLFTGTDLSCAPE